MSRSEIFNAFVKIAQEKGMISNDSSEAKKKLEETKRADSLDADAIAALYGVKPDMPKAMEYKKNIMETAHPNSVVVSPSYDKLNGLVENNVERQNILLHIVNKTPDGLSTQRKYAEKQLLLSLVRIGNDLDNKNQDELRALADTCLEQVANPRPLKKEAAVVLIIGLIAAGLGAIYAHQHLPNTDKGLRINYERLMGELNDFLGASINWGVGHEYDQELKADVEGLKTRLTSFMQTYESVSGVLRDLEKPKDGAELVQKMQEPKGQQVVQAYKTLQSLIENMATYMDQVERNFMSTAYKARHTKDRGMFNSVLEDLHLVGGQTSLFADDFQDVVNAISPFRSSVAELLKLLRDSKSIEEKAAADLQASQARSEKQFGGEATSPQATPPSAVAQNSTKPEAGSPEADDEEIRNFNLGT